MISNDGYASKLRVLIKGLKVKKSADLQNHGDMQSCM